MTGLTVQDTYGEAKAAGASDMEAALLTIGYAAGEAAILNTGLGEWILPELQGTGRQGRSDWRMAECRLCPRKGDCRTQGLLPDAGSGA